MEFQARFPAVTAREATFADDGDKIMVLFRDGVPVEILESRIFDVVYRPVEPAPEVAAPKRKYAKRAEADNGKAVKKSPQPATEATPGGRTEQILAILRKKPMSSGELIEHLNVSAPVVYSATSAMKAEGLIESRQDDDGDGVRRWHPKGLI